jgi:hypothetical protein
MLLSREHDLSDPLFRYSPLRRMDPVASIFQCAVQALPLQNTGIVVEPPPVRVPL